MQTKTQLYCFFKLANPKYANAHTKGRLTHIDMIGAIFSITPSKPRKFFNSAVENQGEALKPSHLEAARRKIWHRKWQKGMSTASAKKGKEIVLNAFTGICYVCKEKGNRTINCLKKETNGSNEVLKGNSKFEKGIQQKLQPLWQARPSEGKLLVFPRMRPRDQQAI